MTDLVNKLEDFTIRENVNAAPQRLTNVRGAGAYNALGNITEDRYNKTIDQLKAIKGHAPHLMHDLATHLKAGDLSTPGAQNVLRMVPDKLKPQLDENTVRIFQDWDKNGRSDTHKPTILKQSVTGHALDPDYARKHENHAKELAEFMKKNPELSVEIAKGIDPTNAEKTSYKAKAALSEAGIKIPSNNLGERSALSSLLEQLDVVKKVSVMGKLAVIASTLAVSTGAMANEAEAGGSVSEIAGAGAYALVEDTLAESLYEGEYEKATKQTASLASQVISDSIPQLYALGAQLHAAVQYMISDPDGNERPMQVGDIATTANVTVALGGGAASMEITSEQTSMMIGGQSAPDAFNANANNQEALFTAQHAQELNSPTASIENTQNYQASMGLGH